MVLEAPAGSKRYESFLSLDMLDQARFISKVRPQGALAGQLGTDRCSNKELQNTLESARNITIDTLFSVFFFFF